MMVPAVLGAAFFAAAGFLGIVLAASIVPRIERFADGPAPQRSPDGAIIAVCAAIGAVVTLHANAPAQLVFFAILALALAAIWHSDVRTGIIPDIFTLGPLACIVLVSLVQRDWMLLLSMSIPAVPFAVAAGLSRGRGMGWGDVKLVALGGAVLGAQTATLAFALACMLAAGVAFLRHRIGQPVAFAPYLVGAIAVAVPVVTLL